MMLLGILAGFGFFFVASYIDLKEILNLSDKSSFNNLFLPASTLIISHDLILFIFLPILIFESAFDLNAHIVRKYLPTSLVLAGPALILTTFLTAALLMFMTSFNFNWGWPEALIFGALISATDPIAVVAIFKDLGISKKLTTILESESLLNDGIAIVLFSVLLVFLTKVGHEFSVAPILLKFIKVILGGIFIGYLFAKFVSWLLHKSINDPITEGLLTILLAFFCMLVAEGIFHVSGVIALVTAGLYMASFGKSSISPPVEHFLHIFWSFLTFVANSLIFFLVGVIIVNQLPRLDLTELGLIFGTYFGIIAIRFLVTYSVRFCKKITGEDMSFSEITIVTVGGLRGAVSLCLALIIFQNNSIDEALRDQIFTITTGVVFLTIFVNSFLLKPLISYLGYDQVPVAKQIVNKNVQLAIWEKIEEKILNFSRVSGLDHARWQDIENDIKKYKLSINSQTRILNQKLSANKLREMLPAHWLQALTVERIAYWKLYNKGTIDSKVVSIFNHYVEVKLDYIASSPIRKKIELVENNILNCILDRNKIEKRSDWFVMVEDAKLFLLSFFRDNNIYQKKMDYKLAIGEFYSVQRVLENLEKLPNDEDGSLERVVEAYKKRYRDIQEKLQQLRKANPALVGVIENKISQYAFLNFKIKEHHKMEENGCLDFNVEEEEQHHFKSEMRWLSQK